MAMELIRVRSGWTPLFLLLAVSSAAPAVGQSLDPAATAAATALERLTADVRFLAADDLAGRQPGYPGIQRAEEMIIAEFQRLGLRSGVADGSYRQNFSVGQRRSIAAGETRLVFSGPGGDLSLELNRDFRPQTASGDFDISGDVVFVGYGISAPDLNYDEYRDLDVQGKIVVLIRVEPQQSDAKSVFDGTTASRYAFIQTKVAAARDNGAVGIILVNDSVTAGRADGDILVDANLFRDASRDFPFVQITRARFEEILSKSPVLRASGKGLKTLAEIEQAIDETLEPLSQPLTGWKAAMRTAYQTSDIIASNIVGVIEGAGPQAEETIIIGAHHDHLGFGEYGSRSGPGAIHNGADDNATGTATVVELARRFAGRDRPPSRRLVFICFSAEEMGLLGSFHYCKEPLWPLSQTAAMVNFDMTGWLRNDRLTVYDWDSSPDFGPLLERANASQSLKLTLPPGGFAGSDHLPFKQRGIPVMFLHTGLTSTYHTPEDDFETINMEGVERVTDFAEATIDELLALPSRPRVPAAPGRFRLGVVLDEGNEAGLVVSEVEPDSPAAGAGIQVGDIFLSVNGEKPARRREVNRMVRDFRGNTLTIVLLRGETTLSVEIAIPGDGDNPPGN